MIADFINYIPDTTIEEVDDESSSDEMDSEYTAKEYGEVIMLVDAFTATIDDNDNDNVNNKIIMKDSLATVSEKKAPSVKYKKYGEDQVKRFFELITEEDYTVPKAAEIAGILRSTAYELKKVWNDSDGFVYPKGCVKRESKKNPDKLKGNTKLEDKHIFFLIELIDKNPCITVMEAKEDLCSKFSDLSITASGVNKHMKGKCGLSLKESKLIEECWSKIKSNIKRSPLDKADNLTSRLPGACGSVTAQDCQGWVRHAETFWDRCINKELGLLR